MTYSVTRCFLDDHVIECIPRYDCRNLTFSPCAYFMTKRESSGNNVPEDLFWILYNVHVPVICLLALGLADFYTNLSGLSVLLRNKCCSRSYRKIFVKFSDAHQLRAYWFLKAITYVPLTRLVRASRNFKTAKDFIKARLATQDSHAGSWLLSQYTEQHKRRLHVAGKNKT